MDLIWWLKSCIVQKSCTVLLLRITSCTNPEQVLSGLPSELHSEAYISPLPLLPVRSNQSNISFHLSYSNNPQQVSLLSRVGLNLTCAPHLPILFPIFFPLIPSPPATLASLLFFEYSKHTAASGSLHSHLLLPRILRNLFFPLSLSLNSFTLSSRQEILPSSYPPSSSHFFTLIPGRCSLVAWYLGCSKPAVQSKASSEEAVIKPWICPKALECHSWAL